MTSNKNKPLKFSLKDPRQKFRDLLREKEAALKARIANEPQEREGLRRLNNRAADAIGSIMPDGTVYAGISPNTGKPIYAIPLDAELTLTFNDASAYAANLNAQEHLGHDDWRVPTKAELNALFNNRAAIGGFDESGSNPSGWYWSSTSTDSWVALNQRFSDGFQAKDIKIGHSSVRLVR
jgi:Protein of unknown function (DUF1566)